MFVVGGPETTTTTTAQTTTTTTTVLTTTTPSIFDSCRFEFPEKGVIDITTLGRTDGQAAFADRVPSGGTNYSMLNLFLIFIFIKLFVNYRI
jgi:hypothetical protein